MERTEQHNNEIVSELLKELGFSDRNLGYKYISDILGLCINSSELDSFNWDMYTYLSNKYNQSYKAVEISIRRAILLAWYRNPNRLASLLSLDKNSRPSNKVFLIALTGLLKRNM